MTIFVTRHPGAVEWLSRHGGVADLIVPHLDPSAVSPGDIIIGTLPVNLVAMVCDRGARYRHLAFAATFESRGRELSADELDSAGASLEEYHVDAVTLQRIR